MARHSLPATGSATTASLSKKLPKNTEALIVPVFCDADNQLELAATDLVSEELNVAMWELLQTVGATGKAGEITRIPSIEGIEVDMIIAVGLGANEDLTDDGVRRAAGVAARSVQGLGTVATTIGQFGLAAAVEGFLLGGYHYTGLKKDAGKAPVKEVVFLSDRKADKDAFTRATIAAEAVNLARDLVNAPSSHLFPESYAGIITDLVAKHDIKATVLGTKELEAEGFGGILAVGNGSARRPRLVELSYAPKKASTHVALVGKGLTFDTGGYSIKPAADMDKMISDMGGSAAVVATVIAAARLGLNVKITALVPLAENMVDGEAYRPGDVITHYGGTTTEILNTDAEGRLVLADALAFACEKKPDLVINIATLTGAQLVALGERTTGVMGSEDLVNTLVTTGNGLGESAWAMPIQEELKEQVKSPVADLRNITPSRWAGMGAAAAFLENFVTEGTTWAHMDIAGPSFNNGSPWGFTPARATGVPVRTLLSTLEGFTKKS